MSALRSKTQIEGYVMKTSEIRELHADELNKVSGGDTFSGEVCYQQNFSNGNGVVVLTIPTYCSQGILWW